MSLMNLEVSRMRKRKLRINMMRALILSLNNITKTSTSLKTPGSKNLLQALLQTGANTILPAPNAVWASATWVLLRARENISARIDIPTSMEMCALTQWRSLKVTCARQVLISSATSLTQLTIPKSNIPMQQSAELSLKTTLMEILNSWKLGMWIRMRACVFMDASSMITFTNALGLGPKVSKDSLMPKQCTAALLKAIDVLFVN